MAKKKKAVSKKKASKSKAPKKKVKTAKKAAKKAAKKTTKKAAKKAPKKAAKKASKKKSKAAVKAPKKKAEASKKVSKKKAKASKKTPETPVVKIKPKPLAKRDLSNRKRIFPLNNVERVEPIEDAPKKKKKLKKLPAAELRKYKDLLLKLRDQAVDGISFLAGDNLSDKSSDRASADDQGTDSFDREFALNLVSGEQELLYEIDDALQRIVEGTYGYCQECEKAIEKNRLEALPHARMCINCKEQLERGKTRYRPFGPTLSHSG